MTKALLVLEDGTTFTGAAIGAPVRSHGEVVFCTAMTGYQEALTDPSFAEQVLVMTYPLQGNYGVNEYDVESRRIQVRAFVVREDCAVPSHWRAKRTLHAYLEENGVPGIAGVDTRALTRKLRSGGVLMGTVTHDETAEQALARLRELPRYGSTDIVPWVSTRRPYRVSARWRRGAARGPADRRSRSRGEVQYPPRPASPRLRPRGCAMSYDGGRDPRHATRRRPALARPR